MVSLNVIVQSLLGRHFLGADLTLILKCAREVDVLHVIVHIVLPSTSFATDVTLPHVFCAVLIHNFCYVFQEDVSIISCKICFIIRE